MPFEKKAEGKTNKKPGRNKFKIPEKKTEGANICK